MITKESDNKEIGGIGGWLLFFVIFQVLSSVDDLFKLFDKISSFFNPPVEGLTISPLFVFIDIILIFILIAFAAISLVLIFKKKQKAVAWVISMLVYQALYLTIWKLFMTPFTIWIFTAIFNLLYSIIWIFYFKKSQRVKNTLIR